MRVLIITNHYIDQNIGASIASRAFINAFATLYSDCSLIYPSNNHNVEPFLLDNIKLYPCEDKRSLCKKVFDIYRGRLHRFDLFFKEHIRRNVYDLIIFDHSRTSVGLLNVALSTNAKILTIHHNVELDYLKDNPPVLLYRIPYLYFLKKAERKALNRSHLNIMLTDSDIERTRFLYNYTKANVFALGIFENFDFKIDEESIVNNVNSDFIITGSLSFPQTEVTTLDFVHRYYPSLKNILPTANLYIAGRNPSKKLLNLSADDSSINVIPNPENISNLVKKCTFFLCPTNMGSGIKLRVLDGLRLGKQVVLHKQSLRGYEVLEKDGILLSYDSPESFCEALLKLRDNPLDRNFILDRYSQAMSFQNGVGRLRVIMSNLLK